MNRRNFLKLNLLSLASMGVTYANPHMGHNMMGHNMDNAKMPMNREIDTSFIQFAQKDLKLLNQKDFPKGL